MGTLKIYRSYNFIDKDPVIDVVRTLVEDAGESYQKVNEMSGVSTTTLYNWFNGQTRRPQYCTIMAIVNALGGSVAILDNQGSVIKPTKPAKNAVRRKRRTGEQRLNA